MVAPGFISIVWLWWDLVLAWLSVFGRTSFHFSFLVWVGPVGSVVFEMILSRWSGFGRTSPYLSCLLFGRTRFYLSRLVLVGVGLSSVVCYIIGLVLVGPGFSSVIGFW